MDADAVRAAVDGIAEWTRIEVHGWLCKETAPFGQSVVFYFLLTGTDLIFFFLTGTDLVFSLTGTDLVFSLIWFFPSLTAARRITEIFEKEKMVGKQGSTSKLNRR